MKEGVAALQNAQAGDFAAASRSIDRMRQLRALLEWQKQQPIFSAVELAEESPGLVRAISASSEMARAITQQTQIIHEWLNNSCDGFTTDQLQSSVEGLQLWLDNVLPLVWDFNQDILMVSGNDAIMLLPLLAKRGQKRVVWITDEHDEGPLAEPLLNQLSVVLVPGSKFFILPCCRNSDSNFTDRLVGTAPPRFRLIGFGLGDDVRQAFERIVREISVAAVSVTTINNIAVTVCKQWLEQLPKLLSVQSVTQLAPVFRDRDVLVASPGPSLDQSLDLLRENEHKFVVVAPLRSVSALVAANVRVDFAVWTDSQEFPTLLPPVEVRGEISLLISEVAHRNMYVSGFRAVFSIPDPQFHELSISKVLHGEGAPYVAGASVSVVAALLPLQLGARSLTLIGQDLSVQHGNYSAAASVISDGDHLINDTNLYCRGIDGKDVLTRSDYLAYANEFSNIAIAFTGKAALYNSTAQGAFLEGWTHVPLRENPVVASQEGLSGDYDFAELKYDRRNESVLTDCLEALELDLDFAGNLCSELISASLKLIESQAVDMSDLDLLEGQLKQLMDENCRLLKVYTSSSSIAVSAATEAVTSLEENLKLSADYYRSIYTAAAELKKLCEKARLDINLPTMETSD